MRPEPTKRVKSGEKGAPKGQEPESEGGVLLCLRQETLSKDSSRSGVLLKDHSGFCVGGGMQEKVWTEGNQ